MMPRRFGKLAGPAILAFFLVVAPACGRKKAEKAGAHGSEEPAAAAVPTPDNTPIDVLRTPAGLVLKTDEPTPRESTPSPAPSAAAPATTPKAP
jgi:hypothetical protein